MFNAKTPIKELDNRFVNSIPVYQDFSELEELQSWEAIRCDNCNRIYVVNGGYSECPNCGSENYTDGPMYNFIYQVCVERLGLDDAVMAIANLPLAIVEIEEIKYLALTGCGMDLSWEICDGYMRLGYLPPAHFVDLPEFAGKKLRSRERWVMAGMRRSLQLQKLWAERGLRDLSKLRQRMARIQYAN
jgi:hypothetical protein